MGYFLLDFALFMFGAALSSAADCAVWKRQRNQSWVHGHSICEGCGRTLRWWEIVPVWSALVLQGHCPRCGYHFGISRSFSEACFGLALMFYYHYLHGISTILSLACLLFYAGCLLLVAKTHANHSSL